MPRTQWESKSSVIRLLFEKPQQFEFFQAVRVLEYWMTDLECGESDAVSKTLKFVNNLSLNFPASEIAAIDIAGSEKQEWKENLEEIFKTHFKKENDSFISITPAFTGLLGINGVLPHHYTEQISQNYLARKDDGAKAFLDLFSNRSTALFYQAWKKYRPGLNFDRSGKNKLLGCVLSLAGVSSIAAGEKSDKSHSSLEELFSYFSSAMQHRPVSSTYLAGILQEYFSVPIRIDDFVGHWYEIPKTDQTSIGNVNSILGSIAVVGQRVWQRDLRIRLQIGPLDKTAFNSFLPFGKSALMLKKLVNQLSNSCLEYEIQLILNAEEVKDLVLNEVATFGFLGWDTFMPAGNKTEHRCDVVYELNEAN